MLETIARDKCRRGSFDTSFGTGWRALGNERESPSPERVSINHFNLVKMRALYTLFFLPRRRINERLHGN